MVTNNELEPDRLYMVTFETPDGWQKTNRNMSGADATAQAEQLPEGTKVYYAPEYEWTRA